MPTERLVVIVTAKDEDNPEPATVDYYPDGCPEPNPDTPDDYDQPHQTTVCPACLDEWKTGYHLSQRALYASPDPVGTPPTPTS
ncbi:MULTISPECIES: hypothetical protein [Pseudofrankia]|uniref:hypothetical protein n=1 Tax=Pseudofrankia TaxID=2994363 RepID=UPI000234B19D|nr:MULTISPECIES: hypothetical protein [Pseudofrankia]OHV40834.1 hypothetical protein BCD49_39270 [Pseudofrankia sp. EUN1h]